MSIEKLKEKIPAYAKDIKLNFTTLLAGTEPLKLTEKQIAALALATAYATFQKTVIQALQSHAQQKGIENVELNAIKSATSVMAMNNVYYRSVHLIQDKAYVNLPSNLRMHILQKHGIEQQEFELYCLAVSAINGCGRCLDSHVHALTQSGMGTQEIHYSIRLASVIQAVAQVIAIEEAQEA